MEDCSDRTSKGIDGNVNKLKTAVAACLEMRSPYPVRVEGVKRGNYEGVQVLALLEQNRKCG